jgi:hypothetical protein
MDEIKSAQKTNCNSIVGITSFALKMPCRTDMIADVMTQSPDKNTEKELISNSPMVNGSVKIVIMNNTPRTKDKTYAGICISFTLIAVLAKCKALLFLCMATMRYTVLNKKAMVQYRNKTAIRYNALLSKTDSIMNLKNESFVEKKITASTNNARKGMSNMGMAKKKCFLFIS